MRYGSDDPFWVVVDPNPQSRMNDILFQASLKDLEMQFKGGLTTRENPAIHTDREKAEIEAKGRLLAMQASQAIARRVAKASLEDVSRIKLLDGEGHVLCEITLQETNL